MKLKVLHVLPNLSMGGAETLVTNYACSVDHNVFDFSIMIIISKQNSHNEKMLEYKGINVIYPDFKLNAFNGTKLFNRIVRVIRRFMFVKHQVTALKPDIIHFHLNEEIYFLPIKLDKNVKLFRTVHNELDTEFCHKYHFKATKYFAKKHNMQLIGLHKAMVDSIKTSFKTNHCTSLCNGVDFDKFRNPQVSKDEMLDRLNIDRGAYVVGHVGRFFEQKNHDKLLDIFHEIQKKKPNSYLILVGTGPLEEKIKSKMKDLNLERNVLLLGNRGDIPEIMNVMNVLIYPSYYEGSPLVLIEAQAANLKCIISKSIDPSVMLSSDIIALDLNDPAEVWCDCALNPIPPHTPSGNLEDYDIKNVVKKLETLYLSS